MNHMQQLILISLKESDAHTAAGAAPHAFTATRSSSQGWIQVFLSATPPGQLSCTQHALTPGGSNLCEQSV